MCFSPHEKVAREQRFRARRLCGLAPVVPATTSRPEVAWTCARRAAPCALLVGCVLEELPCLSVGCALVNDHADSLGHLQRMGALEDVAAHVNATCALADDVICKVQSVALSKLLAASDNNWNWACCNDFLEVLAVVGLNNLAAHLSDDTGCEPGQAGVFGGSFWQYEFNTDKSTPDPDYRVRVNCHAIPQIWQYEALAFKPGLVMRWYRDGFCQAEKAEAKERGIDVYDVMNEHAAKIPAGSHGMLCFFSDVMNYIHWTHASPTFTNFELDPERFNKYTFYRAILENTALLVHGHIDLVKEATGNEPDELIFAGGASKNPLWAQIVADVTGKNVRIPEVKEATALGAAVLAGYGVGIYPSISEGAKRVVKRDKIFSSNPDNKAVYDQLYVQWKDVYKSQLELADESKIKSMWRAPGL